MDVREKLVAWLCEAMILFDKRKDEKDINPFGVFADHLIAHGVTVQEWIPVTERLPDNNERVLVYHDDGMIRFGINKGGFADVVSSLYLQHNHRTCFSKVTHWMPLPQPPKGA